MSFTAGVREELAHAPVGRDCCRAAESAAMIRLGGSLHLSGSGMGWIVDVGEGAVARRLHSALLEVHGVRPQIEVHQPSGLHGTRYRLSLPRPADPALARIGLLDSDGRPLEVVGPAVTSAPHDAAAFVRGAFMVAGIVSDPRRAPHLEIRAPNRASAEALRRLVVRCGAAAARAAERDDGWRVVVKSGAAIGSVLARIGAHAAFLEWDGARLRRELRGEANRATNADEANLARSVAAAGRQVAAIETAVAAYGWEGLPDDLAETALTRVANPQASMAELASLHRPPVGKATVHRRLARIADLAATATAQAAEGGSGQERPAQAAEGDSGTG